jgi:hypothetical protein
MLSALFLALILGTLWPYELVWCSNVTQTLAPLPEAAQNVKAATGDARGKVHAIDVQPINSALRSVQLATGHANAILADAHASLPTIHKGVFLLWKHTDRTLGHLDEATFQEQRQQKAITDRTIATFDVTDAAIQHFDTLVTDPNIPLAISHVQGAAAATDSTMYHVEHVAAHYDKALTAPKRWYQKLRDGAEAAAIWGARHL